MFFMECFVNVLVSVSFVLYYEHFLSIIYHTNSHEIIAIFLTLLLFFFAIVLQINTNIERYKNSKYSYKFKSLLVILGFVVLYSVSRFASVFILGLTMVYFWGYLIMAAVTLLVFICVCTLWIITREEKKLSDDTERQELLCPVFYDEKSATLTFTTESAEQVYIPISALSGFGSRCLDGCRVRIYFENESDGLVRFKTFQFNSDEQARFASQKINDYAQKESF